MSALTLTMHVHARFTLKVTVKTSTVKTSVPNVQLPNICGGKTTDKSVAPISVSRFTLRGPGGDMAHGDKLKRRQYRDQSIKQMATFRGRIDRQIVGGGTGKMCMSGGLFGEAQNGKEQYTNLFHLKRT